MKKRNLALTVVLCLVGLNYSMDVPKLTLYQGLCTEFWDLDKPLPPADEYAFFRHYVSQSSGPILEPMCGTGRYLIPLLEEGFDVEGFDASPFMLAALRKKCLQKNLNPHVWEQYLETVPVVKQYKLIFIPDTAFCIFSDREHIKKCLERIYSLLSPGGIFIFNVQTEYSVSENIGLWTGKAYRRSDGNTFIESILHLPIQNSIAPLIIRYELMDHYTIVKTEMEYYPIKLYKKDEMDNFLKETGFSHIRKIKAHDFANIPSKKDETIVYECIK